MWLEWWPSYEPEIPEIGNSEPTQADKFSDLERQAGELTGNPANTVAWASESDKGVIDSSLNAAQIQNQITLTQTQITELEAKGMDNFSDDDWTRISLLQDQLIELENQKQAIENSTQVEQTATIEAENNIQQVNSEKIAEEFQEIRRFLAWDILAKYPELANILNAWDNIREQIAALDSDNVAAEGLLYWELGKTTQEAVNYLKAPENRQELAHISRDIKAQDPARYEQFKSFLVSQDTSFTAIFDEIESTDTHVDIALDGSDITNVDGDIIYGEGGEKIDMGANPPELSLQGQGDLELWVWPIEAAQTEQTQKEISDVHEQIENNSQQITQNEKRIERYGNMLADIRGYDPAKYASPESRNAFTDNLVQANPELEDITPDISFIETGAEFLSFIIEFVSERKDVTEQQTEVLKAENIRLEHQAGILNARMETQKRIATEKMRNKKERVAASRSQYEKTATSPIMAKTNKLFARISETNPVTLKTGETVVGFNISTFEIEGNFSPSLGEGWAWDVRSQQIHIEIINQILGQELIEIASNGLPIFRFGGEIVDRMKAEAFIAEETWKISFESKAIENLFGTKKPDDEQGEW